jgi:hypothetical protein
MIFFLDYVEYPLRNIDQLGTTAIAITNRLWETAPQIRSESGNPHGIVLLMGKSLMR